MWDIDPLTGCWTNIKGERLRNTDPKYLPIVSMRRDEGAPILKHGGSGFSQRLSRLTYETFMGPCEKTPRQTCGNSLCFNPDHLKPIGINEWKKTPLCKCEKCGEIKPREEMNKSNQKRRHYYCKSHTQETEERRRAIDAKRCPSCMGLKNKANIHREYDALVFDSKELCRPCGYHAFIEWRRKHIVLIREYEKACNYTKWKTRYDNDKAFHILECCRRRLRKLIKSSTYTTPARMLRLIGCSKEHLVHHLESKFLPGMTWDNHGSWHIDHIKPCKIFDIEDANQLRQCFNWTNLQPLWAQDNMKKSDRWDSDAV